MKQVTVKLESTSTYSQSKFIDKEVFPKKKKETDPDYETRVWRERMHATSEGNVYIPSQQFVNSVREAAKYLSIKVPGKGNNMYTKHFDAGLISLTDVVLPEKKDECDYIRLMVPSDGKIGGGKRVPKNFPIIPSWKGEVTFQILDDIITPQIFEQVLETAGNLIGIGYWRPIRRGQYGRFKATSMKWIE